jgi:hypothetical protein
MSAGVGDRVRDRVHAERTRRIARERFASECLGVSGVAVFGVHERRDCEHEREVRFIARPRRHDGVDECAKRFMPAEKKVARLCEPEREQIVRPAAEDGCIALRREQRISRQPCPRRVKVRARLWRRRRQIGGSQYPRDRRQGVGSFRNHSRCSADRLGPLEFRVAGTDVAQLADGIADAAQQMIESKRGC